MNCAMRFLVPVASALLFSALLRSDEGRFSGSHRVVLSRLEALSGEWPLGREPGSMKIDRSARDTSCWSIAINGREIIELPLGQHAYSVSFDPSLRVAVVQVRFGDSVGIWPEKVVVVDSRDSEKGQVSASDVLVNSQLRARSPYYRVEQMGDISSFPIVDLFVGIQGVQPFPALVDYRWVRWNVETDEFVCNVESESAEARLAAAREAELAFPYRRN